MKFLKIEFFGCLDWHDWIAGTEYLNGVHDISKMSDTEIARFIAHDISKIGLNGKKCNEESLAQALLDGKEYEYHFNPYESIEVRYLKGNTIKAILNTQYEYEAWYDIEEIPSDKVRYLPVVEFRRFPKVTPCITRIFVSEAFRTLDEAIAFNKKLMAEHGDDFSRTTNARVVPLVFPVEEGAYQTKPIFVAEMQKLSEPDFWKNFSPLNIVKAESSESEQNHKEEFEERPRIVEYAPEAEPNEAEETYETFEIPKDYAPAAQTTESDDDLPF